MKNTLLSIFAFIIIFTCNSQTNLNSMVLEENDNSKNEIKGKILDLEKQTPLFFANIIISDMGKGTISNEDGYYSIDVSETNENDTISFQYLGYKTKNIIIKELRANPNIFLKEDILNLNDVFIFGTKPDPKEIIEKIIENKESNYKRITKRNKVFIRERFITDVNKINIDYKKSSFSQLNEEVTDLIEKKIPRHSTSYTDFLGYLYLTKNKTDSTDLKINPIKTVSLKDKEIDFKQIENIFTEIFSNEKEKEYWKIKSGIFGSKIDLHDDDTISKKDTVSNSNSVNTMRTSYYADNIEDKLNFCNMNNKKDWEFLYKTNKYKYTLIGGTDVNGEEVYIIDFTPKNDGRYIGRVYVSMKTYALIRADYEYADGKSGMNISLFGLSFSMTKFISSIYFEKKGNSYQLKYFCHKTGNTIGIDRKLSLLKKKERFLIDKKLNEYKVALNMIQKTDDYIELLVLEDNEISDKEYADFKQKYKMKIIYVDQFNDKLWKGHSIIEPTKLIKDYKKQD